MLLVSFAGSGVGSGLGLREDSDRSLHFSRSLDGVGLFSSLSFVGVLLSLSFAMLHLWRFI